MAVRTHQENRPAPTITHPEEQLLLDCFSYSWFDTIDYGRQVELREITKERVKKLLNDWKKAGWMELISRYNKVFDILPTEDFFGRWAIVIRTRFSRPKSKGAARGTPGAIAMPFMLLMSCSAFHCLCGPQERQVRRRSDRRDSEADGRAGRPLSFKKTIKAWLEDPKFRPMFVILPDEVMNEWAEWLAKKSFDLTATGIFSVELPA